MHGDYQRLLAYPFKEWLRIEDVNKKNDQISDITHGLGGTVIVTCGVATTCIFMFLLPVIKNQSINVGWLLLLWFSFIVPTLGQVHRSHKVFRAKVNSTYANEIVAEYQKAEEPVVLTFSN